MTDKLRQCLNIAKYARMRHQWQELIDVKSVMEGINITIRTLPLVLVIITFAVIIHLFILFIVIVKPHPKLPDSYMFFDFWEKCGLESSFGDADRLELLNQWLKILYPEQNFNVANRVRELHRNRAASRRPELHILYTFGPVDNAIQELGLYLTG